MRDVTADPPIWTPDNLNLYLKSISEFPLLKREEEQELGQRIREVYSTLFHSICGYNHNARRTELPLGLALLKEELAISAGRASTSQTEKKELIEEEIEEETEEELTEAEPPCSKKEDPQIFKSNFLVNLVMTAINLSRSGSPLIVPDFPKPGMFTANTSKYRLKNSRSLSLTEKLPGQPGKSMSISPWPP